jgi:hypothetical protein
LALSRQTGPRLCRRRGASACTGTKFDIGQRAQQNTALLKQARTLDETAQLFKVIFNWDG